MDPSAAQNVLMHFVLPVWLAAGLADYLCHRAASIESTSGRKESLLHLLQFDEMGIPTAFLGLAACKCAQARGPPVVCARAIDAVRCRNGVQRENAQSASASQIQSAKCGTEHRSGSLWPISF
jgi:hypothetical protein